MKSLKSNDPPPGAHDGRTTTPDDDDGGGTPTRSTTTTTRSDADQTRSLSSLSFPRFSIDRGHHGRPDGDARGVGSASRIQPDGAT